MALKTICVEIVYEEGERYSDYKPDFVRQSIVAIVHKAIANKEIRNEDYYTKTLARIIGLVSSRGCSECSKPH